MEDLAVNNRVHARFICDFEKKQDFRYSTAIIGISVGQLAHEGEKLRATIELAKKKFKSVTIALGDTLQRHTMSISLNLSLSQLHTEARVQGDQWLSRNSYIISCCADTVPIIRWDFWLNSSDYTIEKEKFIRTYNSDEKFRYEMEKTIDEFQQRFVRRCPTACPSKIREASFAYLMEECVIMILIWKKFGYNYIIYPGKVLDIVAETRRRFLSPGCANFVHWLRVKLRTVRKTESELELDYV